MSQTFFAKGNRLFRENRLEEAVREYRRALKKQETFYAYENLGMALERLQRVEEAKSAYVESLRLNTQAVRAARYLEQHGVPVPAPPKGKRAAPARPSAPQDKPPAPEEVHPVEMVRQASRAIDVAPLKADYHRKGLDQVADTFCLVRVVGNDLYPRHKKGQSRENVRFILDNEPDYPGLTKLWVVNRIVDQGERSAIIRMLEERGHEFIDLAFSEQEYNAVGLCHEALAKAGLDGLDDRGLQHLSPEKRGRLIAAVYRHKNNYVMNNNGARNVALAEAKKRAKWALPWDGNCYLTPDAWQAVKQDVTAAPWYSHFVVPMARMLSNDDLINNETPPDPVEEPQLVFRSDTEETFNEEFCYGRRPKVELFWALGIPGKWDLWQDDPWDPERRSELRQANQFSVAGWVARLESGKPELEKSSSESASARYRVRQEAIIEFLKSLGSEGPLSYEGQLSEAFESLKKDRVSLERGSANLASLKLKEERQFTSAQLEEIRENITHYVFMRFGVGIFDDRWLSHRLGLVESVALPSLAAQKYARFKLVVQVDKALPDKFRRALERALSIVDDFEILPLELHGDRYTAAKAFMQERPAKNFFIATRMDDDDALTKNSFIEIQSKAMEAVKRGGARGVVAIRCGYRWSPSLEAAVKSRHKSLGIGLSFFFDKDGFVNFYQNHMSLERSFSEEEFYYLEEDVSQWLYTTHLLQDTSVYDKINKIKTSKGRLVAGREFLSCFGVDKGSVDRWVRDKERYCLANDKKLTDKVFEIEKEIMRVRDSRQGQGRSQKLAALHKERREITSNIVEEI